MFKVFEVIEMDQERIKLAKWIDKYSYLQGLNEDLLWEAYKDVVAVTFTKTNQSGLKK
jgi:hypothetical protein